MILVMNALDEDFLYSETVMLASTPSTDLHGRKRWRSRGKASHESSSNDSSPSDDINMGTVCVLWDGKVPIWGL